MAGCWWTTTSPSGVDTTLVLSGNSGGATNVPRVLFARTNTINPGDGGDLGYLGFGNAHYAGAWVSGRGDGTWSSGTSHPTRLEFSTTPNGASSPTARMTIKNDGKVGINTTSPDFTLDVNGAVGITEGQPVSWHDGSGNLAARIYASASDELRFERGSGASRSMTIDSSGRLLVGTSSELAGGSSTTLLQVASSTGGRLAISRSGATTNAGDTIGEIAFFDNEGENDKCAAILCAGDLDHASGDKPSRLVFSTTADGATSPTERMRLTSTGSMLLGTTNDVIWNTTGTGVAISSVAIQVSRSSDACLLLNRTGSDGTIQTFARQGVEVGTVSVTTTATAYNTSSDYRLKENVVPLTGAADRLNQLQVHRFNFIADPDKTVDGFLAHEAQAVVPEAVTGTHNEVDDDGNPVYQGIDQSKLVPLLTAALQEALAEIESLKARVTALEP